MGGRHLTRHVRLDGCYNFRDLGGYPAADGATVRWRRLYRSDALHHLTEPEAHRLHDELGVVTLIDLRTEREIHAGGRGWVRRQVIHEFPLIERLSSEDRGIMRERPIRTPEAIAAGYLHMLRSAAAKIAAGLRVLTDPEGIPAVFYCAAGKDRTGVFAAAVLGALGVPDEVIVEDYVLTSHGIEEIIVRLSESDVYGPGLEGVPMQAFHPKPETMRTVLDEVNREHGSMAGYVRSIGVDPGRLRAVMLEG